MSHYLFGQETGKELKSDLQRQMLKLCFMRKVEEHVHASLLNLAPPPVLLLQLTAAVSTLLSNEGGTGHFCCNPAIRECLAALRCGAVP
jgi:hypothetical protein